MEDLLTLSKGGPRILRLADVPEWRNGRRRGLKILRLHGRVGSTPTSGTNQIQLVSSGSPGSLAVRAGPRAVRPGPPAAGAGLSPAQKVEDFAQESREGGLVAHS